MAITQGGQERDDILRKISQSSSYGNLGLFIGTGFSKAVLDSEKRKIALSWGELLNKVCSQIGIDYSSINKEGFNYPQIASEISLILSANKHIDYPSAQSILKREIAKLTCWYPELEKRAEFDRYFDSLSPAWIITTNYDLVLESILTGKSLPLGPEDQLTYPKGIIPIYHLHGIRTNPEDIVISQEDYIALFRPYVYRQIRLALMLKESTVLFLGYGLGDTNVLTALDWSKNVLTGKSAGAPHDFIQVIRKSSPRELPYTDRNGILILETDELPTFFNEFILEREQAKINEKSSSASIDMLSKVLRNPDQNLVERFIDDIEFRHNLINLLSNYPIYLISGFISFLDNCITKTWERSAPKGAFEGYNQNLNIILDILTGFEIKKFPPALFQALAYALFRVTPFIGKTPGQSFAACDTWNKRRVELHTDVIQELKNYAKQYNYISLMQLLE